MLHEIPFSNFESIEVCVKCIPEICNSKYVTKILGGNNGQWVSALLLPQFQPLLMFIMSKN